MGVIKLALAALILFTSVTGQPNDGECCSEKIVGPYEYILNDGYRGTVPRQCLNTCVYTRVDNGRMYCFQPGEQHVECEDEDSTPPEDGRVCPARTLMDSCNVDCLGRLPNCTSTGETALFTAEEGSDATFVSSWAVGAGAEGDTCRLYCPQSNNFDVTTVCSWNGTSMQWQKLPIIDEVCGEN